MPKLDNVTEVVRHGDTYFRARLQFPYDEELGYKPPAKDFYGKTAREAIAKRRRYETREATDATVSFVTYLTETFLPHQLSRYRNGEMVWDKYRQRMSRINRFIVDPQSKALQRLALRKVALEKLRPVHIEDLFRTLEIEGVTANVRLAIYIDLNVAIKGAKRSIPAPVSDYFAEIRKPSPKRSTPKVYDDDTIFKAIHDETKSLEDRALVAFLFIMRCRPSEMYALTWADVDLKAGTVRFDKACRRTERGYGIMDGTKSGFKSDRTLPMGQTLTDLLRRVQKARMAAGKAMPRAVFLSMTGLPLNGDSGPRRWAEVVKHLGLPSGVRFYSLKRAGNSYAARQGVGPEVRAQTMGHTTTKMALEVYRDISNTEIVNSMEVFERNPAPDEGTESRAQSGAQK